MVPEEELVPRVVWTVAKDRAELGRWLYQRFQAATAPDPGGHRPRPGNSPPAWPVPTPSLERLALFVTKEIQNVPLGLGRVGYRPTPGRDHPGQPLRRLPGQVRPVPGLLAAVGLTAQPVFIQERRARISDLACLEEYQDILARVHPACRATVSTT